MKKSFVFLSFFVLLSPAFVSAQQGPPVSEMLETYDLVLSRAPLFFERGWHEGYKGHEELGYFGPGEHDELSMRTLGNFITTYGFLSQHPGYDESIGGVSQEELRRKAIAAIRYMIRTNTTGDLVCTNGKKWGDDPIGRGGWESSWYASKMATGAVLIWDHLTEQDKEGIRKVLGSESDRSAQHPAPTNIQKDTKSEENAWDCESLAWALVLFPDDVRAATWEETLNSYAINTLSVVADAEDDTVVEGKPVSEWYIGANVHPDFTIENHGHFHICYQTCPLHSLAWSVYAYVQAGQTPPETLFHHYGDVWDQLRRYHLWDGRFAYVGGKDWPRYVYGMNFMFPTLAMAQYVYDDDYARFVESKRLELLKWEQEYHDDGSFFSGRFTNLDMFGRHVEYESDVYADMIAAYRIHQLQWPESLKRPREFTPIIGTTYSPYCPHVFTRGENRFASWSWSPRAKPAGGVFAIRGMESALEWDGNLFGKSHISGFSGINLVDHKETFFDGGFAAVGHIREGYSDFGFKLSDDTSLGFVPIEKKHPLFNRPYTIERTDKMNSHDSIAVAAAGWSILAKGHDDRPCVLEKKVGAGRAVICTVNAAQAYLEEKPTSMLFENLVAYGAGYEEEDLVVGLLAGEGFARRALQKMGLKYEEIGEKTDLSKFRLIVAGRCSFQQNTYYRIQNEINEYMFNGGNLVKLVIQDRGFQSTWLHFSDPGVVNHALDHYTAFIALPDDRTCLKYDFITAATEVEVRRDGLRWLIGNDIFNGNERTINGRKISGIGGEEAQVLRLEKEVSIDDRLFLTVLQGEGSPALVDYPKPNVIWGSFLVEHLYYPKWDESRTFQAKEVVQNTVVALDGRKKNEAAPEYIPEEGDSPMGTHLGILKSPNGKSYQVAVNLTDEPVELGSLSLGAFEAKVEEVQ